MQGKELQYPCLYPFGVIFQPLAQEERPPQSKLQEAALEQQGATLLDLASKKLEEALGRKLSRTKIKWSSSKKYLSLTLEIFVEGANEIEIGYTTLRSLPRVCQLL